MEINKEELINEDDFKSYIGVQRSRERRPREGTQ